MLSVRQLTMFKKKLDKEIGNDKYWTKETIMGMLDQLIMICQKDDERREKNGTNDKTT